MTAWELARRGAKVIGLEERTIGNAVGASAGETRIFRTAMHEGPAYHGLAQAALAAWASLERSWGATVLDRTGGLLVGARSSALIQGHVASAGTASYPISDAASLVGSLPEGMRLEEEMVAVIDRDAGVIRVRDAMAAGVALAKSAGASLHESCAVVSLTAEAGVCRAWFADGSFVEAPNVAVTTGPWIGQLVGELAPFVAPRKLCVAWYQRNEAATSGSPVAPLIYDGSVAGWLVPENTGVKVGAGADSTDSLPDPSHRSIAPRDFAAHRRFRDQVLPGYKAEPYDRFACVIGASVDGNFVVGRLRDRPFHVAAGCCGRSFKFAPALGAALAAGILGEDSPADISAFSPARFGL